MTNNKHMQHTSEEIKMQVENPEAKLLANTSSAILDPQFRSAIADALGLEPQTITLESRWKSDLDPDSLDFVNIGINLEEIYDVNINADDFRKAVREAGGDPTIAKVLAIVRRIAKPYCLCVLFKVYRTPWRNLPSS